MTQGRTKIFFQVYVFLLLYYNVFASNLLDAKIMNILRHKHASTSAQRFSQPQSWRWKTRICW